MILRNKFGWFGKRLLGEVVLLWLIVCPFLSGAQGTAGYKNEVGVHMFNLLYYQPATLQSQQMRTINTFNGLLYKRHIGKNIVRSSVEYYQTKLTRADQFPQPFYYSMWGNYYLADMRLGYERLFPMKAFAFYIGLDGVYKFRHLNGSYESYGDFEPYYKTGNFRYDYHYLGFAPLAGFRYQFLGHFSVSAETSMEQLYIVSSNDHSSVRRKMLFNPVRSVSISYLFGKE